MEQQQLALDLPELAEGASSEDTSIWELGPRDRLTGRRGLAAARATLARARQAA